MLEVLAGIAIPLFIGTAIMVHTHKSSVLFKRERQEEIERFDEYRRLRSGRKPM
jgi:hypothetical protein